MFRRLSTRLTVLYAALFGAVLLVVSAVVYLAISEAAERQVRGELAASGTVFDRVWSLRSERLSEGASLLSRDFGFREAAATGDALTISSALENLRRRVGVDYAFMVDVEGHVRGATLSVADKTELARAFEISDDPSGVVMLNGEPCQLVSAPVLSPELIGWVVFAVRLDQREMRALEALSSIPLNAVVLHRVGVQPWTARAPRELRGPEVGRFIERALKAQGGPQVLDLASGPAVVLAKPLRSIEPDGGAVLLLRYPLSRAMASYRPLLAIVGLLGLAGLAVVSWGSWVLARGVTRPLSALAEAARRLQRGEDARVESGGGDEIGRLAESFNTMAAEIRERERRITHQALHDGESGLPNRMALERVVEGLSDRPEGQVYVCALGLDRYGHMRHAVGHRLAAQTVRRVGNRLGGLAPACGVARISADMLGFVVIADGEAAALDEVSRLLAALERPVRVQGEPIDVALSVGLAPLAGFEVATSIERASIALDQARAARRKAGFFDAEAYGDPAANLSLMSHLLTGIADGQLELWHQPKFDLRKRRSTGTEALVRWKHPTRGLIFPDAFIPMAEETGHIRALTEWVVRQAVADQRTLAERGHAIDVAVNISGRVLGEPDFVDFCREALRDAVGRICFEITETAVIENPEVALRMLDAFVDMGVSISIDDFGSGLSSLGYLKRIRGQELKIDRSIVADVTGSQRDALIVRSTIDLAHSLGLKVVAEGVESDAVFGLLAAMGCDHAQGYLIAKPLPLSQLFEFLAEDHEELRGHG